MLALVAPRGGRLGETNMSIFRSREKRKLAASLVAADQLNDVDIAARIGITDRQLRRWKHKPEFRSLVQKQEEKLRARQKRFEQRLSDDPVDRLVRTLSCTQYKAALMVAEDRLTNREIGRRCGFTARCIEKWKHLTAFQAAIIQYEDLWQKRFHSEA